MKKEKSPYFTYPRRIPAGRQTRKNEELLKLLGGIQAFNSGFASLIEAHRRGTKRLKLLEVGTGSGLFARLIAEISRSRQLDIQITAIDFDKSVVDAARSKSRDFPNIDFQYCPWSELTSMTPASHDLVVCCFALNLFQTDQAIGLLQSIEHLSRKAWMVMDLKRTRFLTFLIENLIPVISGQKNGNWEGVYTTQQAFNDHELKNLAFHAAIQDYRWRSWFLLHQALIRHKA